MDGSKDFAEASERKRWVLAFSVCPARRDTGLINSLDLPNSVFKVLVLMGVFEVKIEIKLSKFSTVAFVTK